MQFITGQRYVTRMLATISVAAVAVAATASGGMAQTKVRYSEVIRSIFYLPSYVALKKGYFVEQGIDVPIEPGCFFAHLVGDLFGRDGFAAKLFQQLELEGIGEELGLV